QVELFHLLKSLEPQEAAAIVKTLPGDEQKALEEAFGNLEDLHNYNAHKYRVGSPAVHLDVLESGVPEGWTHSRQKVGREPHGQDKYVNAFNLGDDTLEAIYADIASRSRAETESIDMPKGEAAIAKNAVDHGVIKALLEEADIHGWQPVGIDG